MPGPQGIKVPHPNDVLLGRGAGNYNHHGNIVFRLVIERNKALYSTCTQVYKNAFARTIVETVWNQEPAGRFLEKSKADGLWYEVDTKVAYKKAQQCLREPDRKLASKIGGSVGPQHSQKHLVETERLLSAMSSRFSSAMNDVASGKPASSFGKTSSKLSSSGYSGGRSLSAPVAPSDDNALVGRDRADPSDASGRARSPPHFDDTYRISHSSDGGAAYNQEHAPRSEEQRRCITADCSPSSGTAWEAVQTTNIGITDASSSASLPPKKNLLPMAMKPELIQEPTQSDAANMITLLSRISTVSFSCANRTARRLSRADTLTLMQGDMTPISMESMESAMNDLSDLGGAAYPPPQPQGLGQSQGQGQEERRVSGDLMDDFDDSPLAASIRMWAK